jgi:hypothetical protein
MPFRLPPRLSEIKKHVSHMSHRSDAVSVCWRSDNPLFTIALHDGDVFDLEVTEQITEFDACTAVAVYDFGLEKERVKWMRTLPQ